jgi:hypothetical protein
VTSRTSKDTTVASAYLQALHEHAATVGGGNIDPGVDSGTFTPASGSGPLGFALPSAVPYQLNWTTLVVTFETWVWNGGSPGQYVSGNCNPATAPDCLVVARSTLTWNLRGLGRPPLTAVRVLPP